MSTLVIVPTDNEASDILHTLDEIGMYLPSADVLVVDDGSSDGTGALVTARGLEDARVSLLSCAEKSSLGDVYRAGFAHALARGYDVVVQMDADGSHPAQRLPALVDALSTADLAIGGRRISEDSTDGWPLHRHLLSRMASTSVRWMLSIPASDATSGFRAFRAETLTAIEVTSTTSNGSSLQIETLHRAHECGLTIEEVPISFSECEHGRSKMSPGIVVEALTRVAQWRRHPFRPGTQQIDAPSSLTKA